MDGDAEEEGMEDENMDRALPFDMVCFLSKSFLPSKDRLALALSGALSKEFIVHHGNNR